MADTLHDSLRFVGLDVHKREITYCILDAEGRLLEQQRLLLNRRTLLEFCSQKLRCGVWTIDMIRREERQRQQRRRHSSKLRRS